MYSNKMLSVNNMLKLSCALLAVLVLPTVAGNLARGFNDEIEWLNMEDGLEQAKLQKKPVFMLIHKSWCGACKALKPKFTTSIEILALSKKFAMINLQDDEEPSDFEYLPDGGYIPRILICDENGKVQKEFYNEAGSAQYKYYYPNIEDIIDTMKRVIQQQQKEEL